MPRKRRADTVKAGRATIELQGDATAVEAPAIQPPLVEPPPLVDPPEVDQEVLPPEAAPPVEYMSHVVEPSRCPKCDSTERTGYFATITTAYAGEFNGRRYTHVVRRRTKCQACGQHRLDRSYENRVGALQKTG